MTSPRLERRADRLIGGVAGGIADHLGLQRRVVRAAFVVLIFGNGLGALLYAVFWIVLPGPRRTSRNRVEALGAVVLAAMVAIGAWQTFPSGRLVVPTALAVIGGALLWRQATETDRARWLRASRTSLSAQADQRAGRLRLAVGGACVVGGAVIVLARTSPAAIGDGLTAVAVTVVGLALLTGPWWVRLVTDLAAERTERIRSQERAELAAAVHDSVLQTLALIQRSADDPRTVSRLARGQERELRSVLYGAPAGGSLSAAVAALAADVEDDYAVTVDAVVVGDAALDERLSALVAAASEATVNAAKHSGARQISVYAEVEPDTVAVFVKDRGCGFDVEAVPTGRMGLQRSVRERVERRGGEVKVRSRSGEGTEIELRMPRADR